MWIKILIALILSKQECSPWSVVVKLHCVRNFIPSYVYFVTLCTGWKVLNLRVIHFGKNSIALLTGVVILFCTYKRISPNY